MQARPFGSYIAPRAIIVLALLAAACGPVGRDTTDTSRFVRAARSRGQLEMGCSDPDLYVEPLGAGAYRVRGCDEYITYLCLEDRRIESRPIICTLQERRSVDE